MEPEAPRELGDLEEAEAKATPDGRNPPQKKSLEAFLAEFEANLRDHPGESATTAPAALEGRAEGAWRTPVEGGERLPRRTARRPGWRREVTEPRPAPTATPDTPSANPPGVVPFGPAGETAVDDPGEDPTELIAGEAAPISEGAVATVDSPPADVPGDEAGPVEPAAADTPATAARRRRRHRHGRRHR